MAELEEIEVYVKEYADTRNALTDLVKSMEAEIEVIQMTYIPKIKAEAEKTAIQKAVLEEQIKKNPALFKKPKTHSLHGIKFGYQKKKGKIVIFNEENTIKLIREKLKEKADVLIHVEESVIKSALQTLDVKELLAIGCFANGSGEAIIVKSDNDKIEKFINSLLEEHKKELEEITK